jgi:hypothetical protein
MFDEDHLVARYKAGVTAARHTLAPAAREGLAQALALAHTPAAVQAAGAESGLGRTVDTLMS